MALPLTQFPANLCAQLIHCLTTPIYSDWEIVVQFLAVEKKKFLFSKIPDKIWGPPSLQVNGTGVCFPRDKVAVAWRYHPPTSSDQLRIQ
jgi:hypothetical protein